MVADLLTGAGYRAVCALDGALTLPCPAHAARWRAAVVDLRLTGGLDGRKVIFRLRERQPAMPVVVVTGYDPRRRKPASADWAVPRCGSASRWTAMGSLGI